jgi:LysM domain
MSKVILSAVVASMLLLPSAALAQEGSLKSAKRAAQKAPADEGEEVPEVEGSAQVLPGDGATEAKPSSGAQHTVEKGDTLWDLSQKYLGSPWYWPKVWSYNPEIANPHWIYPGNRVRFASGGDEVPTQVEVGEAPEEEGELLDDEGGGGVQVSGKIGFTPKNAYTLKSTGFVTAAEVDGLGEIVGSFAESELLSPPDTVYVEFLKAADAKQGDAYLIFRNTRELTNPQTGENVGYLTNILGMGKVVRAGGKKVTLQIVKAYDEILRGDRIGPANENVLKSLVPRPNDRAVSGTVITSESGLVSIMAEHHVVVVDRGSEAGLKPGNMLVIYRQGDMGGPIALVDESAKDPDFPKEDIAQCLALEVRAKASTCLVVRSIRQIVPGDSWEMRAGAARTARR